MLFCENKDYLLFFKTFVIEFLKIVVHILYLKEQL